MGNLKERDRLQDLGVDGRIILNWILKKLGVTVWTRFHWLKTGFCECYKMPSGSVNGGEFLDQMRDCQFLMKDSAA
jgi:hypothetical protein